MCIIRRWTRSLWMTGNDFFVQNTFRKTSSWVPLGILLYLHQLDQLILVGTRPWQGHKEDTGKAARLVEVLKLLLTLDHLSQDLIMLVIIGIFSRHRSSRCHLSNSHISSRRS